jgi:Zn-dependent metalloprotease
LPTLKSQLQLNQALDFKILKEEKDALGFTHYRYVQTYLNIPIDESSYIIHVKNNLVPPLTAGPFRQFPAFRHSPVYPESKPCKKPYRQ